MSIEDTMKHQTAIEAALDGYSKGELIRMLSNLMKTYVLDGTAPLKPDVGRVHVPTHLRELDFPSLMETLKFHLNLPDLEKFNIIDGQVYVALGDREYALDGVASPVRNTSATSAPAASAPATSASTPASSAPRGPESATPSSAPRERPRANRGGGVFGGGSTPPGENIPMTPKAPPEKKPGPTEADDRFRMLELD